MCRLWQPKDNHPYRSLGLQSEALGRYRTGMISGLRQSAGPPQQHPEAGICCDGGNPCLPEAAASVKAKSMDRFNTLDVGIALCHLYQATVEQGKTSPSPRSVPEL